MQPSDAAPPHLGLMRAILESYPGPIYAKDADGIIVFVNGPGAALFASCPDEIIGRHIREVHGDEAEVAAYVAADARVLATGAEDVRELTLTRGGETRYFQSTRRRVTGDAGELLVVVIGTEVTAARRAEEASKVKSRFLANMSHEIRTPMNGVMGLIALALDGELTKETRDLLESAKTSADHLLSIINDILDLSKIEAGKVTLEERPFSLRAVVRETTAAFMPQAEAKDLMLLVDISPDVPATVLGDPVRVRQVIANLLGNAMKFTSLGHVRLVVERERHVPLGVEPRIQIGVADTGIGIAPDRIDSIFLPFHQADATTTRRFGGTGLGLTICRELARRMQGDIITWSEPGHGSYFEATLALPRVADIMDDTAPASATVKNAAADVPAEIAGLRVLLAEDNAVNARVATLMLTRLGCVVTHVCDGEEALARFGAQPFDVVLLDVQMPVMGGLECARAIRAIESKGDRVTIVALTANAMKGDDAPCFAAGMDAYLTKPIDRMALREELLRVRRAVHRKTA